MDQAQNYEALIPREDLRSMRQIATTAAGRLDDLRTFLSTPIS